MKNIIAAAVIAGTMFAASVANAQTGTKEKAKPKANTEKQNEPKTVQKNPTKVVGKPEKKNDAPKPVDKKGENVKKPLPPVKK